MEKYYKVVCNGKELEFKEGTTFKEISTYFEEDYLYPILGVKANEDFLDLSSNMVIRYILSLQDLYLYLL